MVVQYTTGRHMTVNGKTYHQDLKIIRNEVKGNWWRRQGHCLVSDDIEDILAARPKVLVIGTGYAGNMRVPGSLREVMENHQIQVITATTADATRTFNRLAEAGEDVAGAFHLTC
jgi:hypothetical protein